MALEQPPSPYFPDVRTVPACSKTRAIAWVEARGGRRVGRLRSRTRACPGAPFPDYRVCSFVAVTKTDNYQSMALARALPALSRANARVERSRVTPTSGSAPPSLKGGHLDPARCLFGLPHPSGAHVSRVRQFSERRNELQQKYARRSLEGDLPALTSTVIRSTHPAAERPGRTVDREVRYQAPGPGS